MEKVEKADKQKRTTSEKPVSLHPVPFNDALRDLMSIKPPKDDSKRTSNKKKRAKN